MRLVAFTYFPNLWCPRVWALSVGGGPLLSVIQLRYCTVLYGGEEVTILHWLYVLYLGQVFVDQCMKSCVTVSGRTSLLSIVQVGSTVLQCVIVTMYSTLLSSPWRCLRWPVTCGRHSVGFWGIGSGQYYPLNQSAQEDINGTVWNVSQCYVMYGPGTWSCHRSSPPPSLCCSVVTGHQTQHMGGLHQNQVLTQSC